MKALILSLSCGAMLLSGCTVFQGGNGAALNSTVKLAAYVGTFEALRQHPEWRLGFELAEANLAMLESSTNGFGLAEVLAVVNQLPVKQFKSDRAVILITAATIIIQDAGGVEIPEDRVAQLRPIVAALREGIALGMAPPPGSQTK